MKDQTIQSLDRGLLILNILARRGASTPTLLAAELGLNQSSTSRLLNSLLKAGWVYKPDYHSFAIALGALEFAGIALAKISIVQRSGEVCRYLSKSYGVNASVGILRGEKLLYLTQTDGGDDPGLRLLSDHTHALHHSSLGLVLLWELGLDPAKEILMANMVSEIEIDALWKKCDTSMNSHGHFWFNTQTGSKFNIAGPFLFDGQKAALAIFSREKKLSHKDAEAILQVGLSKLSASK